MVAFLTIPILAVMSSEQLPVLVLMAPIYLKEFTLAILAQSGGTFAMKYHSRISKSSNIEHNTNEW